MANLSFLNNRNIIILALAIFVFKFVNLSVGLLVPQFLGTIQSYRPLQTGHTMAWVAFPMLAVFWLVAVVVNRTNSRLTLAWGLSLVAVASWTCSRLDSAWAGNNFEIVELLLTLGLAGGYIGLVATIVLQGVEAGANAPTFAGFMHFIRIFGGQVGTAAMTRIITVRERFHDNVLGLHVQAGSWLTEERLHALSASLFPSSSGSDEPQSRAIDILSRQVSAQAYTMAISDGFVVVAWMVVVYLLLLLFLRPAKLSYKDLRKMT